ncbi:reverse transcriptase domain-containing protein [Rhizobium beringeri]|uniref:reverse transcriptase domain-containing protein n=1 Tax=Rhizobium beringeri TaxID=3019934 RepID=UPI003B5C37B6
MKDQRIITLINLMLKAAVVMPDGTRVAPQEGTPQGGPLSPLLSNIVLDELDRELARRRLRFVRYADDSNIFVRSERAGQRVMSSIRDFLERRMRLQVNEEKSGMRTPNEVHFLGFRFRCPKGEGGDVVVLLSRKAEQRLRAKVREMTPPTWGRSIASCIADVSRYLVGWMSHYRLCSPDAVQMLGVIDAHIRRRIRAIIVCQRKRPRFLFRHLISKGVSRKAAAGCAYCGKGRWAKSNRPGMTRAYPPAWFAGRLASLKTVWGELNHPPASAQLSLGF